MLVFNKTYDKVGTFYPTVLGSGYTDVKVIANEITAEMAIMISDVDLHTVHDRVLATNNPSTVGLDTTIDNLTFVVLQSTTTGNKVVLATAYIDEELTVISEESSDVGFTVYNCKAEQIPIVIETIKSLGLTARRQE